MEKRGWTLQSLIDGGMEVAAHCHNSRCNHHQVLDLVALRDRLGPDTPAMADDLTPKLRCSKCGGKRVGIIYSPAANKNRVPEAPKANLYAKTKGV